MTEIKIKKWDGDIFKSTASGTKCEGLLAVHALSGCDSFLPCDKEKVSGLKVLQKNHTAGFQVLGEVNANERDTVEATRKLILAPYGLGKSTNMQHYNILKKQKKTTSTENLATKRR